MRKTNITANSHSSGFTLIELLVVIAIIVSFSALSLYWLSAARHRGNVAICTRNLEAIGQMLANYQSDHRGAFPGLPEAAIPVESNKYGMVSFLSTDPDKEQYLGNKLFPSYCTDPTLFYCPLSDILFDDTKWYKKDDNTFNIPDDQGWSYTYLAKYNSADRGHSDADVIAGKILVQCCSVHSKHNRSGNGTFDRETPILFSDFSVKIETVFKW